MFGNLLFCGAKIPASGLASNLSVDFISQKVLSPPLKFSKTGYYLKAEIKQNTEKTPFYIYVPEGTFSLIYNIEREKKQQDNQYKDIVWVSGFFENLFYVFSKIYSHNLNGIKINVQGKTRNTDCQTPALVLNYEIAAVGIAGSAFEVILPVEAADFLTDHFGFNLRSKEDLEEIDLKLAGVFKTNVNLTDVLNELEGGGLANFIQKVMLKKGNLKYTALFLAAAPFALNEKVMTHIPRAPKAEINALINGIKEKYGALDKFKDTAFEKVNIRYAPLILNYSEKKFKAAAVFSAVKKFKTLLKFDNLLKRHNFDELINTAANAGALADISSKCGRINFLKAVKNNKEALRRYLRFFSKRGQEQIKDDLKYLSFKKEEEIENQIKLLEELAEVFSASAEIKAVNNELELYLKSLKDAESFRTVIQAAGMKNFLKAVCEMENIKKTAAPYFKRITKMSLYDETEFFLKARDQNFGYIKEKKCVLKAIEGLIKNARLAAGFLNRR